MLQNCSWDNHDLESDTGSGNAQVGCLSGSGVVHNRGLVRGGPSSVFRQKMLVFLAFRSFFS